MIARKTSKTDTVSLLSLWVQSASSDPLAAAYLIKSLDAHGIDYDVAIKHLLAHSASFKCPKLGRLIRELILAMRGNDTGPSQTRHVRRVLVEFHHFLARDLRDHPGAITRDDVMKFLARYEGMKRKTWNEARSYIVSIFALAVTRGWLVVSPCATIPRKRKAKHAPPPDTLDPMQALQLMRWLQKERPEWVRYFAVTLFAGVRPDVREGETNRLDEDIRHPSRHLRRPVFDNYGFWVRGKTGKTRHVPWALCGPLREWFTAYPGKGLIPDGLSYSQAERQLQEIRARFGLTHDILRHTAATAMINCAGASFAVVSIVLDNSEAMLRAHYIGIWTPEMVPVFYAIKPTSGPDLAAAAVA